MNNHRNLKAWQRCQDLAVAIYTATNTFPRDERFGIISQIRRAVVSSSSNIAEGHGRRTRKEFVQFLSIALASLGEVDSLIALSERLCFLGQEEAVVLRTLHTEASRLTFALMRKPGR